MAVKTLFSQDDFSAILAHYDLGSFRRAEPLEQGTIQTNYLLETARGRFIFRYYENRSKESILFESELLAHLATKEYPCPIQVKNRAGDHLGEYQNKPYLILCYIDGRPIENLNEHHWGQVIRNAAELQKVTQDFHSPYTPHRWNYSPELCSRLAYEEVERLGTPAARAKLAWFERELEALDLPPELPKGICHCDFHWSNILFRDDKFVALLDFDDANWTYHSFDLVGLVEHQAWPNDRATLDLGAARRVAAAYEQYRPLDPIERQHLYDVYRLSILFDAIWYLERGPAEDFREKSKIDALDHLGRQAFIDGIFGDKVLAAGRRE